jgi:hypothetical protein
MIATSIWHEAFNNSLSLCPIMNVSETSSVPSLNAPLISSYLHPTYGLAHVDATLPSLLFHHVDNGLTIRTATHALNLLLPSICNDIAIMMGYYANFMLWLIVASTQRSLTA